MLAVVAPIPELSLKASPVYQVSPRTVPMLIGHGAADQTVPYAQATAMMAKLKEAGVAAELFTAEGGPHTFWAQPKWLEPGLKAVEEFLTRQFGK